MKKCAILGIIFLGLVIGLVTVKSTALSLGEIQDKTNNIYQNENYLIFEILVHTEVQNSSLYYCQ